VINNKNILVDIHHCDFYQIQANNSFTIYKIWKKTHIIVSNFIFQWHGKHSILFEDKKR